jgi:hypothetical protein
MRVNAELLNPSFRISYSGGLLSLIADSLGLPLPGYEKQHTPQLLIS